MATELKPAPRRTQAERSAETRGRILKAAVTCLYEQGYGATNTVSVAATAKVSRGAMLHHFPSKADLMLATLSHVLAINDAEFLKAAAKIDDAREREAALPDLRLAASSKPAGVAFIEIMMGARSDDAVRSRFEEFRARLAGSAMTQHLADTRAASRAVATARAEAVSRTVSLAVFGLAMQKQIDPQADTEDVLAVLRDLKRGAMEPA